MKSRDALTPVATALLLDLADLITFGPLGLWTGALLGLVLGWTLAPQLGFANRRWLPSVLSGVYCMVPGTALMPLAAILTAVRSLSSSSQAAQEEPTTAERVNSIDAEYESSWDDEDARPGD